MLQNPEKTKEEVIAWIRQYFEENGKGCSAVVGISGGKDSSVTAALCAEALGTDRVIGVLMPNGVQSDISDARLLVETLGIPHVEMNIGASSAAMTAMIEENEALRTVTGRDKISRDAQINLQPRLRMATLYAVAQMLPNGGRVANTCNLSEDYVGYSTKYGDAAGDFSPVANLLVEEIRQLGAALHLPASLVQKTPSDGLSGQSDEDKLGFTYESLGDYIVTGECADKETKEKIDHMHAINLHKMVMMPKFIPTDVTRTLKVDV